MSAYDLTSYNSFIKIFQKRCKCRPLIWSVNNHIICYMIYICRRSRDSLIRINKSIETINRDTINKPDCSQFNDSVCLRIQTCRFYIERNKTLFQTPFYR